MGKIRFLGPTRTVDAAPHVSRKQVKSPEGKKLLKEITVAKNQLKKDLAKLDGTHSRLLREAENGVDKEVTRQMNAAHAAFGRETGKTWTKIRKVEEKFNKANK